MKPNLLIICFLILSSFTLSAQTKKEQKQEAKEKGYEQVKQMLASKIYIFEGSIATTEGGAEIDLTTNPNHLIIVKDSTDIVLPFFGGSQDPMVGLSDDDDGGIYVKGKVSKYKTEYNDKKKTASVRFVASGKHEGFDFSLIVHSTGYSILTVSSTIRNSMIYEGVTVPVQMKEKK